MAWNKISIFMSFVAAALIIGCVAEPYNQGNYVDASALKGKEGIWRRKDVEQTIGAPSFVETKNPNVVYYVRAQGYKYPFVSPTVQKAVTLQVEYDAQGRLKKIHTIE